MSSRATRLSCSATEGVPGADPAGRSMFVVSTRRAARRVLSLSWALDRRSSPEEERESHSRGAGSAPSAAPETGGGQSWHSRPSTAANPRPEIVDALS